MKTGMKMLLLVTVTACAAASGCAHRQAGAAAAAPGAAAANAANTKSASGPAPGPAAPATQTPPGHTNVEDRVGYAIGMSIGNNLKRTKFDVNLDELMQGIRDVISGKEPRMTEVQAQAAIMDYQRQRQHEQAAKNLKEGEEFLAANKQKEGIQVKSVTLADGSTAEFQYRVITEGTGEVPKSNDMVSVNYRGTLINGTEFDSSAKHGGRPFKLAVNRVIRGWTEALQMMKVGSKWQLFIPASLAYEERPSPTIPPGSTLIFEVELLEIDRPKPLTSDIIRVPSAEEMKAGAKIEVIKPEDAERMAAGQTNAAPTEKK